jgi:hypothetical protein
MARCGEETDAFFLQSGQRLAVQLAKRIAPLDIAAARDDADVARDAGPGRRY